MRFEGMSGLDVDKSLGFRSAAIPDFSSPRVFTCSANFPPVCALQRVLEAEENGDGFHDDEDFEIDTPKRKNRNRGKVSAHAGTRAWSDINSDITPSVNVANVC